MATVVSDLVVRLRAETAELAAGLGKAEGELKGFQAATGNAQKELSSTETAFKDAGNAASNMAPPVSKGEKSIATLEQRFKQLNSPLASTKNKIFSVGQSALSFLGPWGQAAGVVAALATVVGVEAVHAYDAHEQALLRLQTTIKNQPTLIGASVDAFDQQAIAIQDTTGVMRDQIVAADAVIGRFGLTADQIKTLNPLIADYATATGQDATTAASNLGRAFVGNTRALKALGVQFTSTGDRTKDFQRITDALQQRVGGLAKEVGQTLPGQFHIIGGEFHDLFITIGKGLEPVVTAAVHGFAVFLGALTKALPVIGHVASVIVNGLAKAILAVVNVIRTEVGWIAKFVGGLINIVKQSPVVMAFFRTWGQLIGVADRALVSLIKHIHDFGDSFKSGLFGAFTSMIGFGPQVGQSFAAIQKASSDATSVNAKFTEQLKTQFIPAMAKGQLSQSDWNKTVDLASKVGLDANQMLVTYKQRQADAAQAAKQAADAAHSFAQQQENAQHVLASLPDAIASVKKAFAVYTGPGADAVQNFANATGQQFSDLQAQVQKTFAAIEKDPSKATTALTSFFSSVTKSYNAYGAQIAGNLDTIDNSFGMMSTDAQKGSGDIKLSFSSIATAIHNGTREMKDFVGNLEQISKLSHGQGQALAQEFLSLGPQQGAMLASTFVSGSKSQQEQLAKQYANFQKQLTASSQELEKKMVGTLSHVEDALILIGANLTNMDPSSFELAMKGVSDSAEGAGKAAKSLGQSVGSTIEQFTKIQRPMSDTATRLQGMLKAIADGGGVLSKNERSLIQNDIATGHYAKAIQVLQFAEKDTTTATQDLVAAQLKGTHASKEQQQAITDAAKALDKEKGSLTDSQKQTVATDIATGHFQAALKILTAAVKDNQNGIVNHGNVLDNWKGKVLNATGATKNQQDALKTLTSELPNNTSKLSDNVKNLIDQASKADNAHDKIQLLRQALEDMARGNYDFSIGANTSQAENQLNNLFDKMRSAGFSLDKAPQGQVLRFHEGGIVPPMEAAQAMSMGLKHDERPAVLLKDEFVVNPRASKKYRRELEHINRYHDGGVVGSGGQAVDLTSWIKALQGGLQRPPHVNVNVDVGSEMLAFLKKQFSSGYQFPLRDVRGLGWGRIDEGVDFTGSGPIYAVGPGKVVNASLHTGWGPPAGPAPGGWVSYVLTSGAKKGMAVYTAEGVYPRIRTGQTVDASTQIANMVAGIETGWAVTSGADEALAHGHYTEGHATPEGNSFNAFLKSLPKADSGAYFPKRAMASMMPGEVALAPDSIHSVRALSKAMTQASRLHEGGVVDRGFVPVPPGMQGGGAGGSGGGGDGHGHGHGGGDGKGGNGDGFHFGKYRKLLSLEKADHIDAILKHVKNLYADDKQKFPTDYVLKTLHNVTRKELDKVAPHRESLRDFVKHLAQNIEPWAGRGHGGGGGGGGGGGNGHGGGIGGGLFGKVFSDFDKTLSMTTTQALADAFVGKLKAEFSSTKALNIGEITKVVDAMFQQVPAENYLNALETRWENAVPGKVVSLSDKKGRNYGITDAILKMLGAKGKGDGGKGDGQGDGQGPVAFHLGPYLKLLKLIHDKHAGKDVQHVKDLYNSKHDFPTEFVLSTLRHATAKDVHHVAPNQKTVKDFVDWLASRIDHSPGGSGSDHGHGDGGHGGGHGGGHLADVVKKLDHVWSRGQSRALSWNEVTDIAHAVGYDHHKGVIMSAISAPESGRQPHPKDNRNTNGSTDAGILQYNSVHHLPNSLVYNPVASFKHAKGWSLGNWATYNNGAYKHFLGPAEHAWGGWHASGLDQVYSRPTVIGVGERGAERVQVTPAAQPATIDRDLKIQVRVDRKRFNHDMDFDYITSGR